jgi:tetratricopeptide (TPR) repeat protein
MISRPDWRWTLTPLLAVAVLAWPATAGEDGVKSALAAAQAALKRQDGIAAEVELDKALKAGASRGYVAAWMGRAKMLQGDIHAAREWLEPGQFAMAMRGEGFRTLGELELAQGNLEAAGNAYEQALVTMKGDSGLWVDIGRMRYRGGEQGKAIEASRQALRLDPKNVRALEFRGQLLRDSKGPAAALPYFAQGLKLTPDDLQLLGEYAGSLGELGKGKAFLVTTRRMIKVDDRNARAFFLQAVLAARAGNDDLARCLLWRTREQLRDVAATRLLQGILDLRAGNVSTASEAFDDLAREQPDNARMQMLLARSLAQDGAYRELVERFADLANRTDASPYLLTLVGRAHEALEDRASAARYLDRAAASLPRGLAPRGEETSIEVLHARWLSDPDIVRNSIAYSRALLADGRLVEGVQVAERLHGRFPGAADLQLLAADSRFLAGDHAGALALYRQSAAIRLSRPLLRRMIAAHLAMGQDGPARDLLKSYFLHHPLDGEAAAMLAEDALTRKDWRRANALFEHALDQGGGQHDPRLLSGLALARLGLGDREGAVSIASNAYLMQRMNGYSAFVLGQALAATPGKQASARMFLAKATRLGL